MRIAVAGGTGLVGRYVVSTLAESGHETVVLSRATGTDLTTGEGLTDALRGVDSVVDVSNVSTTSKKTSVKFFEAATGHLLEAGRAAGISHHVVLSIVGIDLVDFGYYLGKRRQEEVALLSGQPVSVVRATQFHEFAGQLLDRSPRPLAVIPRMLVQPVAAQEVAAVLAELAVGPPVGQAPELAGPEVKQLIDLARAERARRGSKQLLVPLRIPGAAGKAMATGSLLPRGDVHVGVQTFDEWLASGSAP